MAVCVSDSACLRMEAELRSKVLVVAIDFGTTFSGYAYSFGADYNKNPLRVYSHNFVVGGEHFDKIPTSILFTPGTEFNCFGKEAEEKYAKLCEENPQTAKTWFYFERFKMSLFKNATLTRTSVLLDHTQRKGIPAHLVFSAAIGYLKDHAMKTLKDRVPIVPKDITWVLTVPAIWDEQARQFMREAAQQAGIPEKQLVLALEPEAASVYCLLHYKYIQSLSQPFHLASPGKKFMLVDCGGGTVDISVFELKDRSLKQLHRPVGAPAGGTKVDEAFEKLLLDVVGFKGVAAFDAMEMLQLRQAFEATKKQLVISDKVAVRVPESVKLRMEVKAFERHKHSGKVSTVRSNLMFDKILFESLFTESTAGLIQAMQEIFDNESVGRVDAILLAGGFSKCDVIQRAIREAFPRDLVLVAPFPSAAVLIGAVLYGHNPDVIATRVSAFSYGVQTRPLFKDSKHDKARLVIDEDGKKRCKDCFSVHIAVDQEVVNTLLPYRTYFPFTSEQTTIIFDIYRSTRREPLYVDEEGSEKIGTVTVLMPDTTGGKERKVKTAMMVGGTELKFFAKDETSEKEFTAKCNFLSRN